ncbi:hypothetical protein Salmuc_05000 [Salipiger mucosus DSM 16094]|uniref:Polysaccharide chain length determinant N-terminal domain-containing protein n=2 Tax=Salipiger mucosus TaxID=263378 RepID=S9R1A4_9RHOB|nr:hypothetical protein Salmuc_05000 [Salipiger mucosus DSM 16094]
MGALRMLQRRARLIIGITLLACVVALPFIMAVPKHYYSETRVLASPAPALALTAGLDGREARIDMQAELERLLSKEVSAAVIERFNLAGREEFNASLKPPSELDTLIAALRARLNGTEVGADGGSDEQTADKVAQAFDAALVVSRQSNVDVIAVGFTSRDPWLAAQVPGAMVETYLARRSAHWEQEVTEAADWLEKRIATERANVDEARAELDRLLGADGQSGADTEDTTAKRLLQIEDRQAELERMRFDIAASRRSIAAALANPDIPALTEPARIETLRGELQDEVRELDRIALVYGDSYETVKRRKARIDSIRADIAEGLRSFDRTLELRDTALEAEQERLGQDAEAARAALGAIRATTPQVRERTDVLRAREQTLSDLEYRQQLLLSQARLAPVSLEELSPPRVPVDPLGPGRKVYLAGTAIGALLVALLIAAILEMRDTGVRSHEQLAHLPHLEPVGLWPQFTRAQKRTMRRDVDRRTVTPATEALRDMLLMLESAHGGRLPRLLTVTAPRGQDMAVPVAGWIALELAATGRKVRLVETRAAGVSPLRHLIGGSAGAKARPDDGIQHLELPKLVTRHGGDVAAALRAVTARGEEDGAIVIVDAPPLLSPGSLRFARLGGPVLLVLRWGRTPRAVVELAAGLLAKLGAPQVYSLVADVQPRRHRLYGFTDRLTVSSRPGLGARLFGQG